MGEKPECEMRRTFIKSALMTTIGAALPTGIVRASATFNQNHLQVWSCGGLAEAFIAANEMYEKRTGVKTSYTGAFAAAPG